MTPLPVLFKSPTRSKDEPVLILPHRGKTLNAFGLMRSTGDAVKIFTKEGTINAAFVVESIHNFSNSLTKVTVLILDNARIHHAKLFQSFIKIWEDKVPYIFYLPAYSPHLNWIERLWKESKYRWIPPSAYVDLILVQEIEIDNGSHIHICSA